MTGALGADSVVIAQGQQKGNRRRQSLAPHQQRPQSLLCASNDDLQQQQQPVKLSWHVHKHSLCKHKLKCVVQLRCAISDTSPTVTVSIRSFLNYKYNQA